MPRTDRRRDSRVCIVGAGAAGLAAARALGRLGYRRVTVLERERRVGGKCATIHYDGRDYELGAGGLTLAYRNVRALLAETGIRYAPVLSQAFIDVERRRAGRVPVPFGRAFRGLGPQGVRFAWELWRNREIRRPGFDGVRRELCASFEAWCGARHVELIGEMLRPWITGFGYGCYRDVPAAYVLKYLNLFRFPIFEIPEHGYGGLWARVADTLADAGVEIRCGVAVERIERADGGVHVRTGDGESDFDALVLACPLDEALRFLDPAPLEADLISRIRHCDYWAVGVLATGLPSARCLFFPRYFEPEFAGRPMFAYQRFPPNGLTFFYGFARDDDRDGSAARDAVHELVDRLGGKIREVPVTIRWRYFPHVGPEDMAAGFYSKLEGLQGRRATYYCGEILGFATVETTVAYAYAMVERWF